MSADNKKTVRTAMVLAAGRGERLRPLTDSIPKPLVEVGGMSLLQRHLQRLAAAGIERVVINVAHLADNIINAVTENPVPSLAVEFSREPEGALETAGGIIQALDLIGDERFLVVNADTWTDYNFTLLLKKNLGTAQAHLVMVDIPPEKAAADFCLDTAGMITEGAGRGLTFSGLSLLTRDLFAGYPQGRRALRPVLERAIAGQKVSGEYYTGQWCDVGTLDRLELLRREAGDSTT